MDHATREIDHWDSGGPTTTSFHTAATDGRQRSSPSYGSALWRCDEPRLDCAVVVIKRGPNAGLRFALKGSVTSAGRHPRSDIFLDDVTVSRLHAEFRRENDQYQLVDTGSLNGTYVNHEPVQSVALVNGDDIQIGKFHLVFLTKPPAR
ncbi:FHA domain-containing protein [Mycolicibacterium brisbanense]|uniref:Signal transduction protein GarA n=1 Tax=Mycolicibacterium brisbanense TaxID=146020 RepID=A0A100W0T6_9MYCO|nr:FHA domain-containing protein [Mycolicibacterium brisbanense]GAS89471.1 signal transduction protein GarA [Mycolicibacterium brisbanense]